MTFSFHAGTGLEESTMSNASAKPEREQELFTLIIPDSLWDLFPEDDTNACGEKFFLLMGRLRLDPSGLQCFCFGIEMLCKEEHLTPEGRAQARRVLRNLQAKRAKANVEEFLSVGWAVPVVYGAIGVFGASGETNCFLDFYSINFPSPLVGSEAKNHNGCHNVSKVVLLESPVKLLHQVRAQLSFAETEESGTNFRWYSSSFFICSPFQVQMQYFTVWLTQTLLVL